MRAPPAPRHAWWTWRSTRGRRGAAPPTAPVPARRRAGPHPAVLAYPDGSETTRREGAPVADRRCVFIDFDGTFAHRGVAPLAHAEAVHRARANGHLVLLCTGRPASIVAPEVAAEIGRASCRGRVE